jgi:hypothetical protein
MKGRIFVFQLVINIIVNFVLSFIISICDCTLAAASIADASMKLSAFSAPAIIAPSIAGTIIGTIFLMLVPVNDWTDKFAMVHGAKRGDPMFNVYKFLLFVLIMVFVESLCCHLLLFYLGLNPMHPFGYIATPIDWLVPMFAYYPVAFIFVVVFYPIGFAAAAKISGFDPRKLPPEPAKTTAGTDAAEATGGSAAMSGGN